MPGFRRRAAAEARTHSVHDVRICPHGLLSTHVALIVNKGLNGGQNAVSTKCPMPSLDMTLPPSFLTAAHMSGNSGTLLFESTSRSTAICVGRGETKNPFQERIKSTTITLQGYPQPPNRRRLSRLCRDADSWGFDGSTFAAKTPTTSSAAPFLHACQ